MISISFETINQGLNYNSKIYGIIWGRYNYHFIP